MEPESESPQDHEGPKTWTELTAEERRCLTGLEKYYTTFLDMPQEKATEQAWKDIQREHPRLAAFPWFK